MTYLSFSVLHGKNIWVNVLREGLKGRHKTESHLRSGFVSVTDVKKTLEVTQSHIWGRKS